MELQLKNIGMIKEANVAIDVLTVIAGENDTGKSTVAKALHYEVSSFGSLGRFPIPLGNRAELIVGQNEKIYKNNVVLIDTPNSLDTFSFIKNATLLIHQQNLNIRLAMYRVDLILRLSQDLPESENEPPLYKKITEIIGGQIVYDKSKDDIFYRKETLDQPLKMDKTSNGIKMFGFLQILLLNQTLQEGSVLILDEPEVHLHPKWQLEMAKIIVELVKNGVKVLVNSHSPYMIEALQRYSELEQVRSDFYLAEDGYIQKENDSNSETLAKIFEKLSEPFDVFEEMDSENLERLIDG